MQEIVNVDFKLSNLPSIDRINELKAEFSKKVSQESYIKSESYVFLLSILILSLAQKKSLEYKNVRQVLDSVKDLQTIRKSLSLQPSDEPLAVLIQAHKNKFNFHSQTIFEAFKDKTPEDLEKVVRSTLSQLPINICFQSKEKKKKQLITWKRGKDEIYILEFEEFYLLAIYSFENGGSKIFAESPKKKEEKMDEKKEPNQKEEEIIDKKSQKDQKVQIEEFKEFGAQGGQEQPEKPQEKEESYWFSIMIFFLIVAILLAEIYKLDLSFLEGYTPFYFINAVNEAMKLVSQ